jgi:DNA-binding response OmpR family regulator
LRRIVFLTERSPDQVLPAALALGADVKTESPVPDALGRLPDLEPDVIVADAVEDPQRAFDLLTALTAAGGAVGRIAVVARDDLERLAWHQAADEILFPDASVAEVRVRLALLAARRGEAGHAVVRLGPVTINVETYQVTVGRRRLDLTYKEFELLRFLAQSPGRVFSRVGLLREVWGYDFYGGTRTVDVHIRRLRAKLGPEHEHLIETVRGVGYRAANG